MEVPYTWRPTGWFQIGWSADFPAERAVPLRYFGEDLAAYRGEDGDLHVVQAHCPHFGAHLGHGGKVHGDCVTCPYHGWEWGPDGANVSIPYQDEPNRSKRLRVWPVNEQYGSVYLWHHPEGLLQAVRDAADERGVGVLLVEQHVRQALKIADRVHVMERGRIVVSGTPDEVVGQLDRIEAAYLTGEP